MRQNGLELVKKGDARFCEELYKATDSVCATEGLKMIRLSGPTCAGKTTAAKMIVKRMAENGKHAVPISIDDFYYDCDVLHKMSAQKGLSSPDYDSPDTIDVETMAKFTRDIFSKGEAYCPVFDFTTGKSTLSKKVTLGENDILIFEGIQAVYPNIVELFGDMEADCIFIAPLESVCDGGECFEPNEIRLMRRIVRDANFRDTSAIETMDLWKSVRANEDAHIFPQVDKCRYLINSSMPYEIGVLKPHFERVIRAAESDRYSSEFSRMLAKLADVEPISSEYIGEDSLYKEFI